MSVSGIGNLVPVVYSDRIDVTHLRSAKDADDQPRFVVGPTHIRWERVADACAQAKCAYCGRYGALGACVGCGAPNRPVRARAMEIVERARKEARTFTNDEREALRQCYLQERAF